MTTTTSSRKTGRLESSQTDVKGDLLRAARRLLSSEGREGATMRAICSAAGVTPPTLYHYYGDLEGLHKAAIDETYLEVAAAYHGGAEERGPLKGIRDGWATFLEFAHSEPNMCRIVIQQIMAGSPPSMVSETLEGLVEDLRQFHAQGLLKFCPKDTAQLLWMSALGALTFAVSVENTALEGSDEPSLQKALLDITLDALFQQ